MDAFKLNSKQRASTTRATKSGPANFGTDGKTESDNYLTEI